VHPPGLGHLALGGVPERIVCVGVIEPAFVVDPLPRVGPVSGEGFQRPARGGGDLVVLWIEANEVDRQFPPDDQFFEEGLPVSQRRVSVANGKGDLARTKLAEVEEG
jgi:hypothetical protein